MVTKYPKVVAYDFDKTVTLGFKPGIYIPKQKIKDKPNREVVDFLKKCRKEGFKVICHTSRWYGDYNSIKEWLDKHNVPYDDIILGNFKADVYLNDLAVNPLNSDWKERFHEILKMKG